MGKKPGREMIRKIYKINKKKDIKVLQSCKSEMDNATLKKNGEL